MILSLYEIIAQDETKDDINDESNIKIIQSNKELAGKLFIIKVETYNIYIVLLFLNNFFLGREMYYNYISSTHYFNDIFNKNRKNKLYEISSLFITITFHLLIKFNYIQNIIDKKKIIEYAIESPLIFMDKIKWNILSIIAIITFLFYVILKLKIKGISFKTQNKLNKVISRKIITTSCYLIFSLYNGLSYFFEQIYYSKNYNKIFLMWEVISYFFLFVYLLDFFFDFIIYSTSKFCQYKLKGTIVNSVGKFIKCEKNTPVSLIDSLTHEITGLEDSTNSTLIPYSLADSDLVSIYNNNICFEDYFLDYYDYLLNIVFCSLFKVYRNKIFSIKDVKNKELSHDMNISVSSIMGANNNASTNTYLGVGRNTKPEIEEDQIIFTFHKMPFENDFSFANEIFDNYYNYFDNIEIKVISYYTSKCVSNIIDKNITSKIIANSLRCHIIFGSNNHTKDNNRNNDNESEYNSGYYSITSANAEEEYFTHLKNLTIKTYDKQLTLDIFDTNDIESSSNKKNNFCKNYSALLDEYFNYVKARGTGGTFLPILVGVFKIKINSLKTMLVFVSTNSMVENAPKNFYNYWQMVRFSDKKISKVASSKYKQKELINEDLIFIRPYAINSAQDDINFNKIKLKNLFEFEETIKHDVEFLSSCRSDYSSLIMMYYEYEGNQNLGGANDKNMAMTIKKVGGNKVKIVNTKMPLLPEDSDNNSNGRENDYSKKDFSEIATIQVSSDNKSFDVLKTVENNSNKTNVDNENFFKYDNQSRLAMEGLKSDFTEIKNHFGRNYTSEIISVIKTPRQKSHNSIKKDKEQNKDKEKNNINQNNEKNKNNKNENDNENDNENYYLNVNYVKKRNNTVIKNNNNADINGDNNNLSDDESMSLDMLSNIGKLNLANNLLDYCEKVNINSYDGFYDDYKCLCLFNFENIFQLKSSYAHSSFNYNNLQKKILRHFSQYENKNNKNKDGSSIL